MKRTLIVLLLLISASFIFAQSAANEWQKETSHYLVVSQISQEQADQTAAEMESLFSLYDSTFNFSSMPLSSKLNVYIHANKESFNNYLNSVVGQTRDDFVYLHYSNPSRSTLAGFVDKSVNYNRSLAHQGFIQYIKAYIENPPLWMREGFAVYFEKVDWDAATETVTFQYNYDWLPTLKSNLSGSDLIELASILTISEEEAKINIETFYPEAWSIVQFLSESVDYQQIITNSINMIEPEADLVTNSQTIAESALSWISEEELITAYNSFYAGKKTFREVVLEGIDYYRNQLFESAESQFNAAVEMRPDHYVPYYYLGLIYYADNDFTNAQTYYDLAREYDAPEALIDYATGINAFASNDNATALTFLNMAADANPEMFGTLVSDLLPRLN